jgi:hypothetical protein
MKSIISLILIILPLFVNAQSLQIHLPIPDNDSLVSINYDFTIDTTLRSFTITKNYLNRISKFITRKIYSGDLESIDTILMVKDKNEKICQIRIFTCDDNKSITHQLLKINRGFDSTKYTNSIYLGNWTYAKHSEEIQAIVVALNAMLKNKQSACNSTIKTTLLNLSSSGKHSKDERGIIYELVDQMPVYKGSNSIESRDNAIQKYINECAIKDSFSVSGFAIVEFTVLEDGSIDYLMFSHSGNIEIKNYLKKCLLNMKGWKPGENRFGVQKVTISTMIGINLPDINAEIEKLLKASSVPLEPKRKTNEKDTIDFDAIADIMYGDYSSEDDELMKAVENNPRHPNGNEFYKDYLAKIKNEIKAEHKDISGIIMVRFIVERNGSISKVEILKTPSLKIIDYVKDKFMAMPNWISGKQRGKPVRVERTEIIKL